MSRAARVLVVDDSPADLHAFKLILRGGEFEVATATSRDEALARLADDFFHVMLLDVQLDPDDEQNRDGLALLASMRESNLLDAMAVVVTSQWFRPEYVRGAYRNHAVDYLPKFELGEGEGLIAKLRDVLRDEVHFNPGLDIFWRTESGRDDAVVGLRLGERRIRKGTPEAARMADEVEDLLCRLFPSAKSVMVEPMRPGMSGSGVLRVESFGEHGAPEPVVVKFGDAAGTRRELENFEKYVQGFVGGGRSTIVLRHAYTTRLGGIVYSFVGAEGERLEDFGEFYARAEPAAVCAFLERLFGSTCGRWYSGRTIAPLDLGSDYRDLLWCTPEALEKALAERLPSVKGGPMLRFTSLEGEPAFRNPIPHVAARWMRSTATSVTHGDFNQHNILLDSGGEAWLIDFMRTGRGHILRDLAQLDSVVRIQLLAPGDATLAERLAMERALAATTRVDQVRALPGTFTTDNPALRKAFETSACLRAIAARLVQAFGQSDFTEYQLASMFFAVNTIRFYSVPQAQREHALLAAAVLGEKLIH